MMTMVSVAIVLKSPRRMVPDSIAITSLEHHVAIVKDVYISLEPNWAPIRDVFGTFSGSFHDKDRSFEGSWLVV